MDSYKLVLIEDRYGTKSSRDVLIKLLNELSPFFHKHKDKFGFMYKETDVFPKEYYFNTSNDFILERITSKYKVEETTYPGEFDEGASDLTFLGNPNFFPPKF